MKRIVLELTDRCNLRCAHCFEGRHGGRGWLAMDAFERLLREARALGFREFALTGGEPTLHPEFNRIVHEIHCHGYQFGLVSNGWNFASIWPVLKAAQTGFRGVTFSVDGARRETHDRIRGARSFQQVLGAMSVCVARDLPFSINMVITRANHAEIEELVGLAGDLGASGVRFGHLVPTPRSVDHGLYLGHAERDAIDARVRSAARTATLAVALAPGSATTDPFPCEPLRGNEINVDWQGNVTRCCHLSGQTHAPHGTELIGNLADSTMRDLMQRLGRSRARFRDEKMRQHAAGASAEALRYPCEYCLKASGKVLELGEKGVRFPVPPKGASRNGPVKTAQRRRSRMTQ